MWQFAWIMWNYTFNWDPLFCSIFAGSALKHPSVRFLELYKWKPFLRSLLWPVGLNGLRNLWNLQTTRKQFVVSRLILRAESCVSGIYSGVWGDAMSHRQCWASYSNNVIYYSLLVTPFKSNIVNLLITFWQQQLVTLLVTLLFLHAPQKL